jgi:hypothetical protein
MPFMHRIREQGTKQTPVSLPNSRAWSGRAWSRLVLALLGLAALGGLAQQGQQAPQQPQSPQTLGPDRAWEAGSQLAIPAPNAQSSSATMDAANLERRRQIADDSARLLKLATDLKAEVDKTTKDTLSLGVIRKADEIERLAHDVKEKMKLAQRSN